MSPFWIWTVAIAYVLIAAGFYGHSVTAMKDDGKEDFDDFALLMVLCCVWPLLAAATAGSIIFIMANGRKR